jgi:predicted DNA-binding transcriptional regulator AlpA
LGLRPQEVSVEDKWISRQQLADRWEKSKATLDQWATKGYGPRYAVFGRSARYRLSEVERWEEAQFNSKYADEQVGVDA